MARIASKLRSKAPTLLLLVLPLLIGGASLGLILRGQQSPSEVLSDSLVEELLNQQISSAAMAAGKQQSAERLAVPPTAVQPELAIRVMLHNGPGRSQFAAASAPKRSDAKAINSRRTRRHGVPNAGSKQRLAAPLVWTSSGTAVICKCSARATGSRW